MRLLYPLKRTRPKGDPDPGWQRISWDEALDLTADRLRRIAEEHGPQSVVFSMVSPSASASDDALVWIDRLKNAFGSPNLCVSMELCGWGRYLATTYTFGAPVPGAYMPDLENAGCILYWGYNPNLARLVHATQTVDTLQRGARLIVVDPRRTGIAKKADVWLQVRPGTDAALALGLAGVMIGRGWYDQDFIRSWTNGPLLVRTDNGRLLTQRDLDPQGSDRKFLTWSEAAGGPVPDRLVSADASRESHALALFGRYEIGTLQGEVVCRPVFELLAEHCRSYSPERVEAICGVPPARLEAAARMLWEARPVAYYAWSGVEMQTNATQIARAIAQISVLTGSFDARGGNVLFSAVPSARVNGTELLPAGQQDQSLGFKQRPLGPARWQFVTSDELYRGILDQQPYGVHGMLGFGANLLLSHGDTLRGREALTALDFYVHADLFMNPTAELADIVLPVASAFEHEALRFGFEVSQEALSLVQLRQAVAPPRGESRSDMEIVFELAKRLGLGQVFWDGDIEAAYRYQLEPSGLSLEELRAAPGGIRVPLETRYRKFAEQKDGKPRGFATPTRKIELYSETFLEHGYPPLPSYEAPLVGPVTRPDLAERYPLILTSAKNTLFCDSQHRAIAGLRRRAMEPKIELHPAAASERGIQDGSWVRIETPDGSARARARLNATLKPEVVCGQHGWWQACAELEAPGYDPFSPEGANYNLLIGSGAIDPVSGSVPHRAYMCQVSRIE